MNGAARQELIDCLTAGGRLPDTYYDKGKDPTFIVPEAGEQ